MFSLADLAGHEAALRELRHVPVDEVYLEVVGWEVSASWYGGIGLRSRTPCTSGSTRFESPSGVATFGGGARRCASRWQRTSSSSG